MMRWRVFTKKRERLLVICAAALLILPNFVFADTFLQKVNFFVEPDYDISHRESLSATLRHIGVKAYFYIEDKWWNTLSDQEKQETLDNITALSQEFDKNIYPTLTNTYGTEWKPGIDKDYRITILFHQMKEEIGGYNRSIDEYLRVQAPESNQREMIYLNVDYLPTSLIKSYLAHEFTHLITFYQKEKLLGTQEEIWLNEARADYSPTLLGYDDELSGSNLEARIKEFLNSPNDSLCEWKNKKADYGVVNLFTQYLVDHYGIEILKDSLHTKKTGIEAINYALKKNGFEKTFQDIFLDWVLALYLNDCSYGLYYCFKSENLKNFKITPSLVFLPATQKTNIALVYNIKDWSARWFKIIGGNKGLEVEIKNLDAPNLIVPYIVEKNGTEISIEKLEIPETSKTLSLPTFAKENISLILIPTVGYKTSGFGKDEPTYHFEIDITTLAEKAQEKQSPKPINQMTIEELKAKIQELQQEILRLKKLLNELLAQQSISCKKITKNLYYGMMNDPQVRCLQEFLKNQGKDIYPEGLVTGNFLKLTKQAVIRFQEKYKEEILEPLGLHRGTGFVGPKTRAKINQILNKRQSY